MEIPGAISLSYTLTDADVAKYIRFEVIPVAQSAENQEGASVISDAVGPVIVKQAPFATDVRITGILQETKTITGEYVYNDKQGDAEGSTTFRWSISTAATGPFSAITGATAQTYTLQAADAGMYLRFEVTVRSLTGTVIVGEPVESSSVGPVVVSSGPYATNVNITGTLAVGETLTDEYDYNDDNGDLEGASLYKWYRGTTATGLFELITGQTADQYVLQEEDHGRYVVFEVTPVALTGVTVGAPVRSLAKGPIKGYAQIVVDGEIDEADWTEADFIFFIDNQLAEDGGEDNDIAYVYTAWDVNYLYLAIKGKFGNGNSANNLVLYIDTVYDGVSGSQALSFAGLAAANTDGMAADVKFGYDYVLVCSAGHVNGSDHGLYARDAVSKITVGVNIVEDGIEKDAVEVAIAWSAIGLTAPGINRKFAFIPIVTCGDADADGVADDWYDDTGLASAVSAFSTAVTDGTGGLKKLW